MGLKPRNYGIFKFISFIYLQSETASGQRRAHIHGQGLLLVRDSGEHVSDGNLRGGVLHGVQDESLDWPPRLLR